MTGHGIFVTSTFPRCSFKIDFNKKIAEQIRIEFSGVLAANVDGISVLNSELSSNGQIGDAGTGYGFAGGSGSWPGYPANILL